MYACVDVFAVPEHHVERRADTLEGARQLTEREEACRSSVHNCRPQLEAPELRAAKAETHASAALERMAQGSACMLRMYT